MYRPAALGQHRDPLLLCKTSSTRHNMQVVSLVCVSLEQMQPTVARQAMYLAYTIVPVLQLVLGHLRACLLTMGRLTHCEGDRILCRLILLGFKAGQATACSNTERMKPLFVTEQRACVSWCCKRVHRTDLYILAETAV
jgi:hypothetical protein